MLLQISSQRKSFPTSGARIDMLEQRLFLSLLTVTTTADDGPGSLRQAIIQANASSGADRIDFRIDTGPQTIVPLSPLPDITDPVTIDATTQPGFAGSPLIELNGASAGAGADGLRVLAGGSTIEGLVVNRFNGSGMALLSDQNTVIGNYVGIDLTGTQEQPNRIGILIAGSANTIGGLTASARNVISGSQTGIRINGPDEGSNRIAGNFIGTNAGGTGRVGFTGETGILVNNSPNNTIGGLESGAGNVISGNFMPGLVIRGTEASGNRIWGNLIGPDVTGTIAIGNGTTGVTIDNAPGNLLGGLLPGARNVISGNDTGVGISGADGVRNVVQGNLIGIDITGSRAIANQSVGIRLFSNNNLIGGRRHSARNVISANDMLGINVTGSNNAIEGNLIGTDITGMQLLGNGQTAISVSGRGNRIGGTDRAARNIIAAKEFSAITLSGPLVNGQRAGENIVQGNFIGTDITGTSPLGSPFYGIEMISASNTIGGPHHGAGNIIASSVRDGIHITTDRNLVQGNAIGTDFTGTRNLGNGRNGVFVDGGSNNTIGGPLHQFGNTIAFNKAAGVQINTGVSNPIRFNSIFNNGTGGILLTNGGNHNQPAPVLSGQSTRNHRTTITGTVQSTPNTMLIIDFYTNSSPDPAGLFEGQRHIASTIVRTNSAGTATFRTQLHSNVKGRFITATATTLGTQIDTSQFSSAVSPLIIYHRGPEGH